MLKREDFVVLNVQQQVDLVNTYLIQGKSMIDVFKRECIIEADESSVRKRFVKNGFNHDKGKNQYIKDKHTTGISQRYSKKNTMENQYPESNTIVNKDLKSNGITKVIPLDKHSQSIPQGVFNNEYSNSNPLVVPADKTERILKLVDQQPELEELLQWWRNEKNIIEIPKITLDKVELTGQIIGKTFKTYKNVIDKFLEFCDKHKEYMQRDLVSQALLEYVQKYK